MANLNFAPNVLRFRYVRRIFSPTDDLPYFTNREQHYDWRERCLFHLRFLSDTDASEPQNRFTRRMLVNVTENRANC